MMRRFYLTGHHTFGNRGCEAIVRGTVRLLRERFDSPEVLVPSADASADARQWPEAARFGVRFVPAYFPRLAPLWLRLQNLPIPALKGAGWPFPLPKALRAALAGADAVLSVGGDNYTLDYGLPSPLVGVDKAAMDAAVPVALWAASAGPFDREPEFMAAVTRHLSRMRVITARESLTADYLRSLGLENVVLAADPAFTLESQPVDPRAFWPEAGRAGVLGLNLGPVVERGRRDGSRGASLLREFSQFIRHAVEDRGLAVLLVPHVVSQGPPSANDDARYMENLLSTPLASGGRVTMMDRGLNAAQTKHVIGLCRFFIGVRTHATIAALSMKVPTVSLSYSPKAAGINKDLFGHASHVLPVREVSRQSLGQALTSLLESETQIKGRLAARIPEMERRARLSVQALADVLG